MTNNTHGGARPKVRDDDQRGKHHAPKPGSGRKPKSFTLKLDDSYYVGTRDKDGNGVGPGEVWTVAEITRTHVVMASNTGDRVRLVR